MQLFSTDSNAYRVSDHATINAYSKTWRIKRITSSNRSERWYKVNTPNCSRPLSNRITADNRNRDFPRHEPSDINYRVMQCNTLTRKRVARGGAGRRRGNYGHKTMDDECDRSDKGRSRQIFSELTDWFRVRPDTVRTTVLMKPDDRLPVHRFRGEH